MPDKLTELYRAYTEAKKPDVYDADKVQGLGMAFADEFKRVYPTTDYIKYPEVMKSHAA